MHKDFIGWQDGNVETKYIIEYIDDFKTWDKFVKASESHCNYEPWELYSKKEYDNITDAINFFITKTTHKDTFTIKMTENIYYNGNLILENPAEIHDMLYHNLGKNINEDMLACLNKSQRELEALHKMQVLYESFIKKYHAEDSFKNYIDENM